MKAGLPGSILPSNPVSTNDQFISYDDEHSTEAKISYARNHSLGGLMIWELSQDYEATAPEGQRTPLLESVKAARATPALTGIARSNEDIQISFTTAPLGLYRVLSTTSLTNPLWVTLTNNLSGGSNGITTALVTDPEALPTQPQRFYRVQTPP